MPILPIDISEKDQIAIIAPHPDDESIGTGGLLARYSSQCTVILMTDGRHGDENVEPRLLRDKRYGEFHSIIESLEAKCIVLDYEDGSLLGTPSCFDKIDFTNFTKIFLPCADDNHPDHMAACQYAQDRIREQGMFGMEVYQYEVHLPLHSTTHYIDISDVIDQKVQLITSYQSQIDVHDYPNQVRSLAHYRGCQNNVTGRYLEAYLRTPLATDLTDERILEQEKRLEKAVQLNRLLSKWIDLSIQQIKLSDYFINTGKKCVIIYGWGSLGKKVYNGLVSYGIEVRYVLDKNVTQSGIADLEVHPPRNEDASVDAVLVTALGDFLNIKYSLEVFGYRNIISLDSVLEELRFQTNSKN